MENNAETLMVDKEQKVSSNTYKYLFDAEPKNVKYYNETVKETLGAITNFLTSRDTTLGDTDVLRNKNNIASINLDLNKTISIKECLTEIEDIYMKNATAFHHRNYMAHLNCPILIPTLAAEMIISSINSSMDTWDQSLGGTEIELRLIEWMGKKLNYPARFDGVFTSGGTQSNLMGLILARDSYIKKHYGIIPDETGLPHEAKKFRIFCSEISHFSLDKGSSIIGLGKNAIVKVPVKDDYTMDIERLKELIHQEKEKGNIPIAVVGTAGTTDFGSIDPLQEIGAIAHVDNLWFHVDAAYGGGLVLHPQHRKKLSGIEHSDSCTIDFHKTFFQPVSCSGFFMKDKRNIEFIQYYADYLNPKEQEESGVPNLVKKSLQTTRRFDALKLWFTLRIAGEEVLGGYIDDIIQLAKETYYLMNGDPDFEVLNKPEFSALVFRFTPENIQKEQLTLLNQTIKQQIFDSGLAMVAGTKINKEFYLKFTFLNPTTSINDVRNVLNMIREIGYKLIQNSSVKK